MAYKRGRRGRVRIHETNVSGVTDFSLSDPHSMVDTTVMEDSYATQLKDSKGPWTASFSARADDAVVTALMTVSHQEDLTDMWFYPDVDDLFTYFYGVGAFSIDHSVVMGDTVNFSATIDGSGILMWTT